MSKEFFEAVKMLEAEKGIAKEQIYDNISQAVISSLKREYGGKDVVYCEIDEEKQRQAEEAAAAELSGGKSYKDYMISEIMFAKAVNELRAKKHDAAKINN